MHHSAFFKHISFLYGKVSDLNKTIECRVNNIDRLLLTKVNIKHDRLQLIPKYLYKYSLTEEEIAWINPFINSMVGCFDGD